MGAAPEADAAPKPASMKSNTAESPEQSEKGRDVEASALGSVSSGEEQDLPMTFRRFMSFTSMAFLWTGSQIPVYLFGGCPPYIYGDLGGEDRWVWFVLGNLLALAGVCPFVGSLSDLLGRRWVSIIGASLLLIGVIVCTVAPNMNGFIAGMSIAGAGAGINELTALAATAEMAPTRKRGQYVAVLIFTIFPFVASVLYAQLIAYHAGWRYVGVFCCAWNAIGLIVTVVFYHPPPRLTEGVNVKEILAKVDFVGGFLSITGMILFLAGLQWGGYQYPWTSAHVLVPLILGVFILAGFVFWEIYYAAYPMFPRRIGQEKRTLVLTLIITFISGANFFSILMFWPTQAFNVYGHDPVQVGLRGLPAGLGIMSGACIVLWLLTLLKGHNKELLIASSVLMTAGCGALAVAEVDNLHQLWGILTIAGLGIGGIVVPASIITTIICPDDLIATVAALTLSIRVIGGSIGYTIYFNVFSAQFEHKAVEYIGGTMVQLGVTDPNYIGGAILLTANSLIDRIRDIPGIAGNETAWEMVVHAGRVAYAESYKYVYYTSIAFGTLSIAAACFLGNIEKYMDDHIAVVVK